MKEKVFIVHGHDSSARNEVELFIRKMNLEPIILFQQVSKGATIIEKLLREAKEAKYAIVLYTGCDQGKAIEESSLKPRARQNVVFEHGLMYALLGKKRVAALVEESVEIPGDLSGVVFIELDKDQAWQFKLAREMKAIGLSIDLNNLYD
jgi:predicted nucleotide-binding protein